MVRVLLHNAHGMHRHTHALAQIREHACTSRGNHQLPPFEKMEEFQLTPGVAQCQNDPKDVATSIRMIRVKATTVEDCHQCMGLNYCV
jgi:hypothetical protein